MILKLCLTDVEEDPQSSRGYRHGDEVEYLQIYFGEVHRVDLRTELRPLSSVTSQIWTK